MSAFVKPQGPHTPLHACSNPTVNIIPAMNGSASSRPTLIPSNGSHSPRLTLLSLFPTCSHCLQNQILQVASAPHLQTQRHQKIYACSSHQSSTPFLILVFFISPRSCSVSVNFFPQIIPFKIIKIFKKKKVFVLVLSCNDASLKIYFLKCLYFF